MRNFWKIALSALAIYFFSWLIMFLAGINKLPIQSEDTLPAIFMPVTIIKEGTLYADTYFEMIRSEYPHPDDKDNQLGITPFYFKKVNESYVSAFPLISGLLAVPVYLIPVLAGIKITWLNLIILAHISAAIIMAVSGGLLYLFLRKHLVKNDKKATLLTIIYLFGTINYALLSQALWQHGTLEFFIILCLFLLYERRFFWSGIALGFCALARPTAMLLMPFISLIFLAQIFNPDTNIKKLKFSYESLMAISKYLIGISLAILFFFYYTRVNYVDLVNNGYSSQLSVGWKSKFPEGFLGMWFSPSKGILVYSPIFIFSFISFFQVKNWKKKENLLYIISFAIVLSHTLILSMWKHWYGGWSYGYRMASDIIPFLILMLVPLFNSEKFELYKKWIMAALIFSILVEIFGIIFFDGIWHAAYDDGFVDTAWLWSIKDSEFVFNIRRILVKLGCLERACPVCL